MKILKKFSIGCVILLVASGAAFAGDHDKGKHSKDGGDENGGEARKENNEGKKDFRISDSDRRVIQEHFSGDGKKGLPPGLAKKAARGKRLPPGWEKKMVKGEIVPPQVFENCQPLPPELVVKLPAPPAGTITVTIGGKAARLVEATHEILDVFDILPKPPVPRL
ncbi:MAG TPA: hypothetical protein VH598_04215 [Verrucomicrobiae bacterium]|nr:hypothetical protein [Verrucomicrobiae bacterium]